MRQIYDYTVIRYFPTSLSEEFINIGVFLNGYSSAEKIITEENARELHCSALIGDKKKLLGLVEYLNELSVNGTLQNSDHYFNNFRFSDTRQLASDKSKEEIIEELYFDFVGYKFIYESKIPKRATIIKNSFEVAKEFQGFIQIYYSNTFDLEIESIKKQVIHNSFIGSAGNKQDVANMIMLPQEFALQNEYDFLDISQRVTPQKAYFQEKLKKNDIKLYSFSDKDEIANYFEKIA